MNAIIETAIKKIYLTAEQPDVAAVIEEVRLKCFKAKTETSSAADPATDFRHSQIMCFRSHSICAEQPIFANNLRFYIKVRKAIMQLPKKKSFVPDLESMCEQLAKRGYTKAIEMKAEIRREFVED